MIRQALRSHRPYLAISVLIAVASTAFVASGAYLVQRRLDGQGLSSCVNPNVCGVEHSELPWMLGMELLAAFVPVLLGLILGVPLFTRKAGDGVPVLTKLLTTMVAGALCTGLLATIYRLVAARYTLLANDRYELLDLIHLNNIGYMVMQTVFVIAVAGVVGLWNRSFWRTLVFCAVGWPLGIGIVLGTAEFIAVPLSHLPIAPEFPSTAGLDPGDPRYWTADLHFADGFAYPATVVFLAYVLALVLIGRRVSRAPRAA